MGFVRFLRENVLFLSAGVLLTLTSSFGQTYFISLFAGKLMAEYALSNGEWGLIYTAATTCSAITMVWAGTLTDTFRIRHLAVGVCLVLALACLAMAVSTAVWLLVIVIFFLRLSGQGMLSELAVVAMARWFVATRGRALSVAVMGFAMGQAVLPVTFVSLMERVNWRLLWVLVAALVLLAMPVIFRLLRAERTPQSVAESTSSVGMGGRHWTRRDVLHHWLFWAMIPVLLGPPAFGTALFFNQVHLTEVKGWALGDFVALLPLFTLVSIGMTFLSGNLIDRFGTPRLISLSPLPFAVAFLVLAQAETLWGAALGMTLFGIGAGFQTTVPAAFWAEFFGTRHLGAIKAMAAAVMVFGSAIGPGLTSVLIDEGLDFPDQMVGIAGYYMAAAAVTMLAIQRARKWLPPPSEIDIVGA